jgi:acetylornithine deacetylase/succinyl-diaminopimelate desuccinylase-like protein
MAGSSQSLAFDALAHLKKPLAHVKKLWPFSRQETPDPINQLPEAAAKLLADSIRFNTTNPPGDEAPLARFLARFLTERKIETRVIETPRGTSLAGRAAVWARVEGTGESAPLILLSHLDTVPAVASNWIADPFLGMVTGGYVLGRGAIDAKGLSIVHALVLANIAERETPFRRDIIFLAVPDEETGGRLGAGFITERHREILNDAEFLLTEGGGIRPGRKDGSGFQPDIWGVSVTEKTPCWLELSVSGQAGHGSTAGPDASVPVLISGLAKTLTIETEIRVIPEVARMFQEMAVFAPEEDRPGLSSLEHSLNENRHFKEKFLSSRVRNSLVRDTLAITVLEGSNRTNVMPASAKAHLDARILPGGSCENFTEKIRKVVNDPRINIRTLLSFSNQITSTDTPLYRAIKGAASNSNPTGVVIPRVSSGFTDAHYFRDIGIHSYGFAPRRLPPSETRGVHGINERISIKNLVIGVHTYIDILERLDDQELPRAGNTK